MRITTRTAALAVAGTLALAAGASACTYDHHEICYDRLSCRTADHSLHTVQLVINRNTYSIVAVTAVHGDATVKKTTTYAAVGTATRDSQWRGPYTTGRTGNVNIKGVGSLMFNTWVETTHGNCLATGETHWEGPID